VRSISNYYINDSDQDEMIPKSIKDRIAERKSAVREKRIEQALCDGVSQLGGEAWKLIGFDFTGFPDRTVFMPGGRLVFTEIKRRGKKPSPRQYIIRDALVKLGFDWRCIDTEEQVTAFLNEIKKWR